MSHELGISAHRTVPAITQPGRLMAIKTVHTIVWAFFVTSIAAIPVSASAGRFDRALACAGIVSVEVLVLALNRMRCPLTTLAARYTQDRRANFDIYLPEWLARHNKEIFGTLFLLGLLYSLVRAGSSR